MSLAGEPTCAPAGASRPGWRPGLALVLCVGAFLVLAWRTAILTGPTFDEPVHLADGFLSLRTGDFFLNPEHPPLVKQWAALPLLFHDGMPDVPLTPDLRSQPPWDVARALFFSKGPDYADTVMRLARRQMLVLGALTVIVVFIWSAQLWGRWAGVFSAALMAFCPTFLGHGSLIHTDVTATLSFVLIGWLSWRCALGAGWPSVIALGAALGFALGVKFSGVLAIPPVLLVLALAPARPNSPTPEILARAARIAVVLAVAWAATVVIYGWPPKWNAYFQGISSVYGRIVPDYEYYFLGRRSPQRFPLYFVGAMAVKASIPALLAWTVALCVLRRTPSRANLLPMAWAIWLLAGAIILAANIGVRYILPVFAMLNVWAGVLLYRGFAWPRWRGAASVALALGAAVVGVRSVPDGIAYFNAIGGPPSRAVRLLDDSNLDWGQALPQAASYIRAHPKERVYVAWRAPIEPADYGVSYERLIDYPDHLLMPDEATYIISPQWLTVGNVGGVRGLAFDWLEKYRPAAILGRSIWVYKFRYAESGGQRFDRKTGIQWIDPVSMFGDGVGRLRELAWGSSNPALLEVAALGSVRLGVWLRAQRNYEGAARAFLQARADGGQELAVCAGLALVYGQMGDFPMARQELDRLRQIAPGHPHIGQIEQELDRLALRKLPQDNS